MSILIHIRLDIDKDTLMPITEYDEKKVGHACLIDRQIILMKQAHAMLRRRADMMPTQWR